MASVRRTCSALLLGSMLLLEGTSAHARKPATNPPKRQTGVASWFRSKKPLTGAHRSLPLGSKVRVRAPNGKSVMVTITDRGPWPRDRIIDLSSDAFKELASLGTGLLRVTIERIK